MASYALEEPCEFIYRIKAVTKVVDGDTVDCVFDLGFDVMFHSRVRLLGIDTPESRTRHKNEKIYGKLSKKKLKEWVHWAVESDRDDIDIELDGQVSLNDKMGFLSTVEDARKSLENIFKNNIDKPNNP